MYNIAIKQCLLDGVRSAGSILRARFGEAGEVARKESAANVVCAADLAAETCIIERIRSSFPDHGIIAEEAGFAAGACSCRAGVARCSEPMMP